jgi:uncharacterized protein YkwD
MRELGRRAVDIGPGFARPGGFARLTARSHPESLIEMSVSRRAVILCGAAALLCGCSTLGSTVVPGGATRPAAVTAAVATAKINATRAHYGAPPLAYSTALEAIARTHSRLMAKNDTLSHTLGGVLRDRLRAGNYHEAAGEDLAAGHKTLEAAIGGWLGSASHRETLLNPKFTEFGLAVATSAKGTTYWTFIAGGPQDLWF